MTKQKNITFFPIAIHRHLQNEQKLMSSKVVEVIELLDSDDDESDNDEIVVIETIESSVAARPKTASRRRKWMEGTQREKVTGYGAKRPKVESLKEVYIATASTNDMVSMSIRNNNAVSHDRIVTIDNNDADDAVIHPGILKPTRDWINSGNTTAIVQHICQNDKWSCGYRNLQMMLSSVLPHLSRDHAFYQKVPHRQDQVTIPSLRQIQRNLEQAWREGFDPRGAAHYRNQLYGKSSWIGALEVSSVLSYWGIESAVIQFIRCRESRELLPRFFQAYFAKCSRVRACPFCSNVEGDALHYAQHFLDSATTTCTSSSSRKCQCPSLPLYLQWEGHSVTVVGMQGEHDVLIYDPLKKQRPTRLCVSKVIAKDTQVVLVSSFRPFSSLQQQKRKQADSESRFVATAAVDAVSRAVNKR